MFHYDPKNLQYARKNRKERNATHQESVLWHLFLKSHSTNFTRQYRIGKYILDFYAPSLKLAIEIDGGHHYEDREIEYDQMRTKFLNEKGIAVLRFTNADVDRDLKGVVLSINNAISELKSK